MSSAKVNTQLDTSELVARAKGGARDAFAELTQRHLRAAYVTALVVVGDVAEAEDLAQEGLMLAFERLESCQDPARFSGWLRQIVRNRALNVVERRRVRSAHLRRLDATEVAEPGLPVRGLRSRLVAALASLTEVQREVVLLHDLDAWTHAEIASALGISETSSRQHLFNARRALRGQLADVGPQGGEP